MARNAWLALEKMVVSNQLDRWKLLFDIRGIISHDVLVLKSYFASNHLTWHRPN